MTYVSLSGVLRQIAGSVLTAAGVRVDPHAAPEIPAVGVSSRGRGPQRYMCSYPACLYRTTLHTHRCPVHCEDLMPVVAVRPSPQVRNTRPICPTPGCTWTNFDRGTYIPNPGADVCSQHEVYMWRAVEVPSAEYLP